MSHDLTMTGAGYDTSTPKFGTAALNSGRGSVSNLLSSGDFTLAGWVKHSGSANLEVAFGQEQLAWCGKDASNNAHAAYGDNTHFVDLTSSVNIADGNWHYLELCCSAAGGKLFVDGVLAASSATSRTTANPVYAGTFSIRRYGATTGFDWTGEVDEVSSWTAALHSSGYSVPVSAWTGSESNLNSLWHLDSNGTDSLVNPATSYSLSGSLTGTNGAANSLTLTPNGTWPTDTITVQVSAGLATLNGGSSTSINLTPTAGTTTPVTFTVQSVSSGSSTLHFSDTGGLSDPTDATYTSSAAGASIAVNDANLHFYGFKLNGSTNAVATTAGSYFKGGFTGTSCIIKFDVTRLQAAGTASGQWPRVRWSVDGGAWSSAYQLASADAVSHIINKQIASGLSSGNHTFILQVVGVDAYTDRWGSSGVLPISAVVITGLILDNGATTYAPTLATHRIGFDGDSILEGAWIDGTGSSGQYSTLQAGQRAYAAGIAAAFAAEYDDWAQGGTTWDGGFGSSNVPAYYLSDHSGWLDNNYFGAAKTLSGYDYYFVCLGANGLGSSANVTAALSRLRSQLGNSTIIFVAVPVGGQSRSGVTTGFNAWTDAAGVGKSFLLDIGTQPGLAQYPTPSAGSYDGLHPDGPGHALIAALFVAAMKSAMAPSGSGSVWIEGILL